MNGVSLRANETLEATLDQYGDMILRLAFSCLKSREDAEDILQEPLLRDIYRSDLHILYLEELGRKVCVAGSLKSGNSVQSKSL